MIIPNANIKDLMLKQEIVDAAEAGFFSVHGVDHVEQAMELLSGLPAGAPNENEQFPRGSINYLIQFKLAEWIALRLRYINQQDT